MLSALNQTRTRRRHFFNMTKKKKHEQKIEVTILDKNAKRSCCGVFTFLFFIDQIHFYSRLFLVIWKYGEAVLGHLEVSGDKTENSNLLFRQKDPFGEPLSEILSKSFSEFKLL